MKILILGGYGIFGGRLAQLLADDTRLSLIIAGRSEQKAVEFCLTLQAGAARQARAFDRNGDVAKQLLHDRLDLVIDATGPFQSYGNDPYCLVKACIDSKINYMDFADASDFVKDISQFNPAATAAGIYVLSGVSSFPILTAAVVRRLSCDMAQVKRIQGGIAPSPFAVVGMNVIRAIASYAGQPVKLVRKHQPAFGAGLIENTRHTISPPGYVPLRNIRFSLVDVPDLQVLPELWPELEDIWIGAGTQPEILHRMLNWLSRLVRWKMLPSLTPFAPLFHFVTQVLRWGEHRGGMFVAVTGVNRQGENIERSWHLLAEGTDGPFIPAMALEALILRDLGGRKPHVGARPGTTDLELEDYEALFKSRTIYTGVRESAAAVAGQSNYQKILGSAWHTLPAQIRAMHDWELGLYTEGRAEIERGTGFLSKIIGVLFDFPKAGKDIPVQVRFHKIKNKNKLAAASEVWTRTFADKSFFSIQSAGQGRFEHLIDESFGPLTFSLALFRKDDQVHLAVRHWRLQWGFVNINLPLAWAAKSVAYEYVEDGKYRFDIAISHQLAGLIVRYRGWLVPVGEAK